MRLLSVIMVAAICTNLQGADYLVTKGGVWQIELDAGHTPTLTPLAKFGDGDRVIYLAGNGDDPAPPPDDLKAQVTAISKNVLQKPEADALALIIGRIRESGTQDGTMAISTAVKTLADVIGDPAKSRILAWKNQVDRIVTKYDQAAMRDVQEGLEAAWAVSGAWAQRSAVGLATVIQEGDCTPEEAMDWERILQIVMLIIEILKNLGIIK